MDINYHGETPYEELLEEFVQGYNCRALQRGLTIDISDYCLEEYSCEGVREQRGFLGMHDISMDNGLSREESREALGSWYV